MTTKTKLPNRTAESILQEIDNGSFKNWTIAEKALNIDSLELSKAICARKCSEGDLQKCVRLELSSYHQRIHRALLIIENQHVIVPNLYVEVEPYQYPAIVPYQYIEVKYPVKEESTILFPDGELPNYPLITWAVIGFMVLAAYLYQH